MCERACCGLTCGSPVLTHGRKDLHISSTTCCGVREKCGTTLEMEPKKVEAPYEIERDIYIVLSLVLV